MNKALETEITTTFADLDKTLGSFSDEQLNKVPFEGSWTGGQVADHISKSIAGASGLLNGPTMAPDREPDKNVKQLRDLFLDFNIKMKSPDFILPGDGPFKKETFLSNFDKVKKGILATKDLDPTQLCTAAEMPGMGQMTRLEWVNFFLVHTQRHTHQLKSILQALN